MSTRSEAELAGVGGPRIHWQSWLPDGTPQAVIVIAHGAGEHSGRYEHVAARFLAADYAAYAIDHRGHGRSSGPRALIDRLGHATDDLDALVLLAASAHPGVPLFLLGHSMGGTIAVSYALAHQDRLAGLVLSGPLAALEAVSPLTRVIAGVLSAVAPRLPAVAVDASLVSRDPAVVAAYRDDPLVHHGKLPVRTLAELAAAIGSFPEAVGAITIPTLIMYGTDDRLCPPSGSLMLEERIGSSDKTIIAYDGLYHEILNEPEQDRVLDDICGWVAQHAAAPAPQGSITR